MRLESSNGWNRFSDDVFRFISALLSWSILARSDPRSHAMCTSHDEPSFGNEVDEKDMRKVTQHAKDAYREIHPWHLLHADAQALNMLYSYATNQVVVTDFERAKLMAFRSAETVTSLDRRYRRLAKRNVTERARDNEEEILVMCLVSNRST
ncbi:hypothetical protein K3495_g10145 [Podosphaera aphanis]|nr:hypothetical protein K3495_g10145 [Podosphaera aphanis]